MKSKNHKIPWISKRNIFNKILKKNLYLIILHSKNTKKRITFSNKRTTRKINHSYQRRNFRCLLRLRKDPKTFLKYLKLFYCQKIVHLYLYQKVLFCMDLLHLVEKNSFVQKH